MGDIIYTDDNGEVFLDLDVWGSKEVTFSKESLLSLLKGIEDYESKDIKVSQREAWVKYKSFWDED